MGKAAHEGDTTGSAAAPAHRGLAPGGRVTGTFRTPGSKSIAQRVLLAAALAEGTTFVLGVEDGDDVRAARRLAQGWCPRVVPLARDRLSVQGLAPEAAARERRRAPGRDGVLRVDVGESGTLARLGTAALALGAPPGSTVEVRARGTLLLRSSRPLFEALGRAGVRILRQNVSGTWPVQLVAAAPPDEVELVRPVSSQEASGLVLALAAHAGTRRVRVRGRLPSRPYLHLTAALLERFGARVTVETWSAGAVVVVEGPLVAPDEELDVEPDASGAAVCLAAACLTGGDVTIRGLGAGSAQGDVRIAEHLAAFGATVELGERSLRVFGTVTRAADLDLEGEPDLAPVLAVVAADAARRTGEPVRLGGLGTLLGKESDRLGGLAAGLAAAGFPARAGDDWLELLPGAAADVPDPAPVWLDPRGDHRMAFAFALLGLLRAGVHVTDPGCVSKSWPGFWEDLADLGAPLVEGPPPAAPEDPEDPGGPS